MSGLVIDLEKCRGCGRCARACASGGIRMEARKAYVTDGCILCGMCVDTCVFGAIAIERDEPAEAAPAAGCRDVWVFAQRDEGKVAGIAYELLGKGRELADARGCNLVAVLGAGCESDGELPADVAADARSLVEAGADRVVVACDPVLGGPATAPYAAWICSLIEERSPEFVLFGATVFGRELAPTVACRMRTGLTADCTKLEIDPQTGLLQQTRPTFGGNLMATIVCPDHRPQMATVRPGVLPAPQADPSRTGEVEVVSLPQGICDRVRVLEVLPALQTESVADAEVLVVVGRGIGSKKNLPLMRRLAAALGAKLGCSRPIVEQGWLEYPHQVGQTGCSVAPKLLVSVGVSGAIQHLAGIGGAQTVVAINSDPEAPIFGVARHAVVGDCVEVVKELLAILENEGESK